MSCKNGLLPEDKMWYTTNYDRRKVIEKEGKKIFLNLKHPMRTDCIARRPSLTLKDTSKKAILLIDIAYSKEYKKIVKRDEMYRNYHLLCIEL